MKLRAGLLLASVSLGASACGDGEAGLMRESLMGQMSALCPGATFHEPDAFASVVERLGLAQDGGVALADPSMDAEPVSAEWVSSTDLGARSTIWRGRYGPGEWVYGRNALFMDRQGNYAGASVERRAFERAEVCVAHAPHLTRAEGLDLARAYGMDLTDNLWAAGRNAKGEPVSTSLRMVLGTSDREWVEIEFLYPADTDATGVIIVRRKFTRPDAI